MKYLVTWNSKDVSKSVEKFKIHHEEKKLKASKGGVPELAPGVKVLESLHVVGEASGYILIEVTNTSSLQSLLLKWGEVLDFNMELVMNDEEAANALI